MYVDYTDEQKALRQELRADYEKRITPDVWKGLHFFGGGVNEVRREIVSMLGLGLPRAPR